MRHLDGLAVDLRSARRSLAHRPGFTAIAVGIPGSGIGVTTAAFALVYAVLLGLRENAEMFEGAGGIDVHPMAE